MRRLIALLLCAAVLFSLVGCAFRIVQDPQPPVQDKVEEQPPAAEKPDEPAPQPPVEEKPEEPEVPEEPQEEQPPQVVLYAPEELVFDDDTYLQPGPEGTVLIINQRIVDTTTMPYRTALYVTVYDPTHGQIIAQTDMGEDCYILSQVFADQSFCVMSEDGKRYDFYDKQLEYVHTYRRPVDQTGYFSNDKRYFYYADGVLKRHVMASGVTEEILVADGLPVRMVVGIHPTMDELTVIAETDPFGLSLATAVLNAKTGQLQWFRADYVNVSGFDAGAVYYLYDDNSYRVVYAPQGDGQYYEMTLQMSDLQAFHSVSNSALMMAKTVDQEQSVRLYRFSQQPEYADLSAFSSLHDPIAMLYDASTNSIFYSVRASEEEPCRVMVLDLDYLNFVQDAPAMQQTREAYIDSERIARYFEIDEPVQLRGGLEYLRELADEIEQTYDVEILFSGECAEPCAYSDFAVQTTDSLSLRYESQLLYNALTKMEQTLASYPEGFFSEFKSENTSGVRFLLVSTIESSYGVVAYEYFRDGWFNIVYDVNYQSKVTANLNHELWHAIEEKMNFIDGVWLDETLWSSFNPEEFVYSEAYENHYDNSSEYVYYTEYEPERVYFIDTYSKTFSREDRARIMEYALTYPYFMERLQYSEAIMQKLGYLAQILRESFDSSAWPETTLWEEYLPQEIQE